MNVKEVIGKKSKGAMYLYGAGFILITLVLILVLILFIKGVKFSESTDEFTLYLLLLFIPVVGIVLFVNMIHISKLPLDLIRYDDDNLSIYFEKVYKDIPLASIIQATPKMTYGRGISYTFGSLKIHTDNHDYVIHHVANCENVCLEIMKLVKNTKLKS